MIDTGISRTDSRLCLHVPLIMQISCWWLAKKGLSEKAVKQRTHFDSFTKVTCNKNIWLLQRSIGYLTNNDDFLCLLFSRTNEIDKEILSYGSPFPSVTRR